MNDFKVGVSIPELNEAKQKLGEIETKNPNIKLLAKAIFKIIAYLQRKEDERINR